MMAELSIFVACRLLFAGILKSPYEVECRQYISLHVAWQSRQRPRSRGEQIERDASAASTHALAYLSWVAYLRSGGSAAIEARSGNLINEFTDSTPSILALFLRCFH